MRGARGGGGRITENDGKAIMRDATSVSAVVPFLGSQAQIVMGDKNVSTPIAGTSRGYLAVRGFTIAEGAMFTDSDERLKAKVCVVGHTVKENLFGKEDAVGQVIRIGRYPFRVVGVLATKGQSAVRGRSRRSGAHSFRYLSFARAPYRARTGAHVDRVGSR